MSVNEERPHLVVLPEDKADLEIALGFELNIQKNLRQMQILRVSGGWSKGVDEIVSNHEVQLRRNPLRHLVLLIDVDNRPDRVTQIKERVARDVQDRFYVIGASSTPEKLKASMKRSYEEIGEALAKDCAEETDESWSHELLKHNAGELDRLRNRVRSIFF